MSPTQAPKVDVYDDQIFVVLKIARLTNDEIKDAEVDAFVSGHHIITVRHDEDVEYVHAHDKMESGPLSTRPGPDFRAHSSVANAQAAACEVQPAGSGRIGGTPTSCVVRTPRCTPGREHCRCARCRKSNAT